MIPFSDPMGEALEAYLNGQTAAAISVISNITEDDVIPVSYLFRDFDGNGAIHAVKTKRRQPAVR